MVTSSVRTPVARVIANGALVPGLIEVDVESTSYFKGGRFRVRASSKADIGQLWMQAEIMVSITASVDSLERSLIVGRVDTVQHDLASGIVEAHGRDLTSVFVESRLSDTFVNQTSSQVAAMLAARHGLTPDITATSALIGQYYRSEHDSMNLDQFAKLTTEWDLLSELARRESFEVWIDGSTLHFGPRAKFQNTHALYPTMTTRLTLQRHLTLASDLEVTVKSWNSQQQAGFTAIARTNARSNAGTTQKYTFIRPNLTTAAASALARQLLGELSIHERHIEADLPGDVVMTARDLVSLSGTGTDYDQFYQVCELRRRFSARTGFVQTIIAKNSTEGTELVSD